jgi:hypothetical protein
MEIPVAEGLLATVGAPATTWTRALAESTKTTWTQGTLTAAITLAIADSTAISEATKTSQDLSNIGRDASSISKDSCNNRDISSSVATNFVNP